jgi:hypothetical protein
MRNITKNQRKNETNLEYLMPNFKHWVIGSTNENTSLCSETRRAIAISPLDFYIYFKFYKAP